MCTDGAPCWSRSGLLALVTLRNTAVAEYTALFTKRPSLPKRLSVALRSHLEIAIKIVNFIKGSALIIRLFRELCDNMDTQHQVMLFHIQVRGLSKGNMFERFYELYEEVRAFLADQRKEEPLSKMSIPNCQTHLTYIVDISEALGEFNPEIATSRYQHQHSRRLL